MNRPLLRARFEDGLGFVLDPFQREALDALDRGSSVLVAAPTSSGKTVVAEYAIAQARAEGRRAAYTTPLKALSNQKWADLRARFGVGEVGLLTGDRVLEPDAPILVMTTEVLRNMIYASSPVLDDLAVVVLDEVHYLQDPSRGAVWEEVIVHAPAPIRLVCLSATVSNAGQVGEWLRTVRGPTEVVESTRRPVPLEHDYLVADRADGAVRRFPTLEDGAPNPEGLALERRARAAGRRRPRGGPARPGPARPSRLAVVRLLLDEQLTPAIVFIFSRRACDDAVASLVRSGEVVTTPEERRRIGEIVDRHLAELSPSDLRALGAAAWRRGLEAGVAAHHAGLVPPFKEAVEECVIQSLVKVVFATETLALGVNLPARSVVIESLSKFTGERHEPLTPTEYTQLAGRAGRRGIDAVGHVLTEWSPWHPFSVAAGLAMARSFTLTSSFRPTYNMAANLIRRYDREEARRLVNLSLAQFQVDAGVVQAAARADARRRALAEAQEAAHCERGDVLELAAEVARLREEGRRPPPQRPRRAAIRAEVARLDAGTLLEHPLEGGPVVVVEARRRRGGEARVLAVDAAGHRHHLTEDAFRDLPVVLGRLEPPFGLATEEDRRSLGARVAAALPDGVPEESTGGPGRRRRSVQAAIERALARHPAADCPDFAAHLAAAERVRRLEREVAAPSGPRRTLSLAEYLDRVVGLLERLDFVSGWSLTPAGERLARLHHEQDLVLAVAIDDGVFDDLGPAQLAGVAAAFAWEDRGRSASARRPSAAVARRLRELEGVVRLVHGEEALSQLPPTPPIDGGFAGAAEAWAEGADLGAVLEADKLSAGDFVRHMRQLADVLEQIAAVTPEARTHRRALEARSRVLRDLVAVASGGPTESALSEPALDLEAT